MDITNFQFIAPTRNTLCNYWEAESELAYAVELGSQPIRRQVDYIVDEETGEEKFVPYFDCGDCTVYLERNGMLTFEYYEGSPSGNPEDGERITYFYLQCVALEAAKHMALIVIADIEHMDAERYIAFGFLRTEA